MLIIFVRVASSRLTFYIVLNAAGAAQVLNCYSSVNSLHLCQVCSQLSCFSSAAVVACSFWANQQQS